MSGSSSDESGSSPRIKYLSHQQEQLEKVFEKHTFIDASQAQQLAQDLGVSTKQIRTWFQNKRAKLRRQEYKNSGRTYSLFSGHRSPINHQHPSSPIASPSSSFPPIKTSPLPYQETLQIKTNNASPRLPMYDITNNCIFDPYQQVSTTTDVSGWIPETNCSSLYLQVPVLQNSAPVNCDVTKPMQCSGVFSLNASSIQPNRGFDTAKPMEHFSNSDAFSATSTSAATNCDFSFVVIRPMQQSLNAGVSPLNSPIQTNCNTGFDLTTPMQQSSYAGVSNLNATLMPPSCDFDFDVTKQTHHTSSPVAMGNTIEAETDKELTDILDAICATETRSLSPRQLGYRNASSESYSSTPSPQNGSYEFDLSQLYASPCTSSSPVANEATETTHSSLGSLLMELSELEFSNTWEDRQANASSDVEDIIKFLLE